MSKLLKKSACALFVFLVLCVSKGVGQELSPEAQAMSTLGLVNIKDLDSTIHVCLKYSTTDNFVGENLYGTLAEAYLQPDAAKKLAKAQAELKKHHPNYSLIVYDAARPQSVQRRMWKIVEGTPQQQYVANPKNISAHTYGVAVDVSIIDESGEPLDMGSAFDYFGAKSEPKQEAALLKKGELSKAHIANRDLLRLVMKKGGFVGIRNEWWHFQSCTREKAKAVYKPID